MQIDSSGLMQLGTMREQSQRAQSQVEALKQAGEASRSGAQDEKLKKACQDFQSILIKKMLDAMRDTVQETGMLDGGHAEKIFEDRLYNEYAQKMSQSAGFGLDEMIYRELTGKSLQETGTGTSGSRESFGPADLPAASQQGSPAGPAPGLPGSYGR